MSSRDSILGAIRRNRSGAFDAPEIPRFARSLPGPLEGPQTDDLVARFTSALEGVGGSWEEYRSVAGEPEMLRDVIRRHYPEVERIVSAVADSPGPPLSTMEIAADESPARLAEIELAIVSGQLGVAENGAVWVSSDTLPHPALPFVAEHLVLLLAGSDLVADMHDAYRALSGSRPGYGVFISGPSKTADIEQSLVMGAQGPRTALVLLEGPPATAPAARATCGR